MASVHWVTEKREGRPRRYVVRYRLGGEGSKLHHLKSCRTQKEADAVAEWARMRMARGLVPDIRAYLAEQDPEVVPTVRRAVTQWLATRIDLSAGSRRTYEALSKLILDAPIAKMPVTRVEPVDALEFVHSLADRKLARDTISATRGILAAALDEAGVESNPARHRSVRLPREQKKIVHPPPYVDVCKALDHAPAKYRVALALLEATGLRISEACNLRQVDVDRVGGRVRVRYGKGDKHRFAPLPVELAEILPEGNPVLGVTPDGIRGALERACDAARIERFSPHDLRHRFAARQVQLGAPITQVAAWLGHAKPSMTTDVYAVVITDTLEAWRHATQLSHSDSTVSTASRRA